MKKHSQNMFGDRRRVVERRSQNLSMPAGLDRRSELRRASGFQNSAWWLNVDYSEELVSIKASEMLTRENIRVRKSNDKKTIND